MAEAAGRRAWCEKAPFNLLSARFLLRLFPEATTVMIVRHPVQGGCLTPRPAVCAGHARADGEVQEPIGSGRRS